MKMDQTCERSIGYIDADSFHSSRVTGAAGRRTAARLLSLMTAVLFAVPLLACEREQGNPLPKTPPKPRIVQP